ncbi:MAG: zf-TFIIB domain-containing protein [Dehalococcoidia bacterium]|nr:zf-TFIIB domain-containing protein [Dehalococcoidia bacterium]
MKCPVCKISALVIEYERIELDYCSRCGGVWFDEGELELLLDAVEQGAARKYVADTAARSPAETEEKARKCPICNRPMKKTLIGENGGVMVDSCEDGHGLWFDGGELNRLLMQMDAETPAGDEARQSIARFLNSVFQFKRDNK